MNEIKFVIRLKNSERWVSSPTHTTTTNPNLCGVFTAKDESEAQQILAAMERQHGTVEVIPWKSSVSKSPTDRAVKTSYQKPTKATNASSGWTSIHGYTRRQAIADGVQIDVSQTAREAGITFPVYLTRAVWDNYVQVPSGVEAQDEAGRLWDVLWMLRCAAARTSGSEMTFQLHVRNDNRPGTPPLVTLKAICGPCAIDDLRPAITVMLLRED